MGSYKRIGYDNLWGWFGLSYASWLTIPRVLMHEMPDKWQKEMARLLNEFDDTWETHDLPNTIVQAIGKNRRFTRFPEWLLNYRRPNETKIDAIRRK